MLVLFAILFAPAALAYDDTSLLQREATMKAGVRKKPLSNSLPVGSSSSFGSSHVCTDDGFAPQVPLQDDAVELPPIVLSAISLPDSQGKEDSSSVDTILSTDPTPAPIHRYVLAFVLGLALSHALGLWRDDSDDENCSQVCCEASADAGTGECLMSSQQDAPAQRMAKSRKRLLGADSPQWQDVAQAVSSCDSLKLKELLAGSCSVDLNASGKWGCTLLHNAALAGSASCVELLLDHGAQAHVIEAWEETPLHFASRGGNLEVCKVLLAHGASINILNAQDWTPLLCAGHAGHEPVCKLLLDHGAGAGGVSDDSLPPLLVVLVAQRAMTVDQHRASAH